MLYKTIALTAVLLASGVGAAFGQATIPSNDPSIQNPGVNPSAAGTQTGRTASGTSALKKAEEQGGSKQINANTHPLTALKARKLQQKQGGYGRQPRQTMEDAGAGR
jgi:hypothetical protein